MIKCKHSQEKTSSYTCPFVDIPFISPEMNFTYINAKQLHTLQKEQGKKKNKFINWKKSKINPITKNTVPQNL